MRSNDPYLLFSSLRLVSEMKFNHGKSKAWHNKIDALVGVKKPTDPSFPWDRLNEVTEEYLKNKGDLKSDVDACLLNLIEEHPAKVVAIAACAYRMSETALRALLPLSGSKNQLLGASGSLETLLAIIVISHVKPGTLTSTKAQRARYLLSRMQHGSSLITPGQQFEQIFTLFASHVHSSLLLQNEINEATHDVSKGFAEQLDGMVANSQWENAHRMVRWMPSAILSTQPQVLDLLHTCLPNWRSWAAWQPNGHRIHRWIQFTREDAASLTDLLALEGPDFCSEHGFEQDTLWKGLIIRSLPDTARTINWGTCFFAVNRNPFEQNDQIFKRMLHVLDFASSNGGAYTQLIKALCLNKVISSLSVSMLEEAQHLVSPSVVKVIAQVLGGNPEELLVDISAIQSVATALVNARFQAMRKGIKPILLDRLSGHIRGMHNVMIQIKEFGMSRIDAAIDLVTFLDGLKELNWLRSDLEQSTQHLKLPRPGLDTLISLRDIVTFAQDTQVLNQLPLCNDISAYCGNFTGRHNDIDPRVLRFIENFVVIWRQISGQSRLELAFIIANIANVHVDKKLDLVKDVMHQSEEWVTTILSGLTSSEERSGDCLPKVFRILALEKSHERLVRWRQPWLFVLEKRDDTIIDYAIANWNLEETLKFLRSIQKVYRKADVIQRNNSFRLLDLDLHLFCEKIIPYVRNRAHVGRVIRSNIAMRIMLLGSTDSRSSLLCILELLEHEQTKS